MPIRDAGVDHRDANALTRHVHLLACERGSRREAGPLHRREDRPIEIDALDARIRSDPGKLDVVHFRNLAAAAEASSGLRLVSRAAARRYRP